MGNSGREPLALEAAPEHADMKIISSRATDCQ
jgi:hypothetical protein